ncbi:flavin reductase family protein [Streptomyces sp. NPDC053367]|uniref:flavin reductase family protein n=1 Tax=Streptomyces sp. NPDC053367 TaxID=3365700 RepID=UPI0037CE1EA0
MTPTPAPTSPSADPQVDIRVLMSGFPTGVTIVTATAPDATPWGMTCSSLVSVSARPPVLLVCLRSGSPTLEAVAGSGRFAVNLLRAQARPAAMLFASGAADRFDRVAWRAGDGAAGPHLLDAAHSVADCTVVDEKVVGDHSVVMGRVDAVTRLHAQEPLLYGMRRFESWPEDGDDGYLFYDFIS